MATKTAPSNGRATNGKASSNAKARPVHEIRLGRVKAAIWENETQNGVRHNVTVSRLYKDDDNQWRDTSSFGRDDLPLVIKVLDLAHDWIFQSGNSAESSEGAAF